MSHTVNLPAVVAFLTRCAKRPCQWCGSSVECDCIERIACNQVGVAGHLACGFCEEHEGPRFSCMCPASNAGLVAVSMRDMT